jgi:acyl carrier protein
MSNDWTLDRIIAETRRILRDTHGIDIDDRPDTITLEQIGIDSMQVMDIVMDLEDLLGIKIAEINLKRSASLGDVAVLIQRYLPSGA